MQLLKRFHPTGNPGNSPNSGGWQTWLAAHSDIIKYHFAAASMRLERAFMSVRYIHANILLSSCSSDGWLLFHSPVVSSRNMCHTTFQAAICVPVKNLTFILNTFKKNYCNQHIIWSISLGKHWFFETLRYIKHHKHQIWNPSKCAKCIQWYPVVYLYPRHSPSTLVLEVKLPTVPCTRGALQSMLGRWRRSKRHGSPVTRCDKRIPASPDFTSLNIHGYM